MYLSKKGWMQMQVNLLVDIMGSWGGFEEDISVIY